VGLHATASYLPERRCTAAEVSELAGIPDHVVIDKFGLREKRIAGPDEHASDLSVRAAERLLVEAGIDPEEIDVVMYYGSTWKDWAVWQAAPWIAHRLGCRNAFAVEYDNVSHGTSIALRMARDILRAEPELRCHRCRNRNRTIGGDRDHPIDPMALRCFDRLLDVTEVDDLTQICVLETDSVRITVDSHNPQPGRTSLLNSWNLGDTCSEEQDRRHGPILRANQAISGQRSRTPNRRSLNLNVRGRRGSRLTIYGDRGWSAFGRVTD